MVGLEGLKFLIGKSMGGHNLRQQRSDKASPGQYRYIRKVQPTLQRLLRSITGKSSSPKLRCEIVRTPQLIWGSLLSVVVVLTTWWWDGCTDEFEGVALVGGGFGGHRPQ